LDVDWGAVIGAVEGGTPIKEYWEQYLESSDSNDLKNVPYETLSAVHISYYRIEAQVLYPTVFKGFLIGYID
jgi:hypothetical protein